VWCVRSFQGVSFVQLSIISCGLLLGYGPQAEVHNRQWTFAMVMCVCLVSHVIACLVCTCGFPYLM
jgi:hypothetical protein